MGFVQQRTGLCLAIILFATALGLAANSKPYWKISPDGVHYVGSAKNLAEGQGLQLFGSHSRLHPPLLSLYFSLGFLLPGSPVVNLQLLQALPMLATVGLTYLLIRRLHSAVAGLFVAAMVGLNQQLTVVGMRYLSEPLYITLMLAALYVSLDLFRAGKPVWGKFIFLGVLAGLSALTRIIGVVLFPSIICSCLFWEQARLSPWRLRILAILVILLLVAPFVAWSWYNAAQPVPDMPIPVGNSRTNMGLWVGEGDGTVRSFLQGLPRRVAVTGPWRIEGLFRAMIPPASGVKNTNDQLLWEGHLLCVPWAAAFVWGWWQRFRMTRGPVEFFVAGYLAVLLLHPSREGCRFLLPLVPIGWLYVTATLASVTGKRPWRLWAACIAAAALLIASATYDIAKGVRERRRFRPMYAARKDFENIAGVLVRRPDVPTSQIRLWVQKDDAAFTLHVLTNRPLVSFSPAIAVQEALERSWQEGVQLLVLDFGTKTPHEMPDSLPVPFDRRYRPVYRGNCLLMLERVPPAPPGFRATSSQQ